MTLYLKTLFFVDQLSFVMMGLVTYVTLVVASFSFRFLSGDRKKGWFYVYLLALLPSVFIMVCTDHLFLLLTSWGLSNFILTQLMLHKKEWEAAKQSSRLALKNFGLGCIFLGFAFAILYFSFGETSIQSILNKTIGGVWGIYFLCFLILAAMTQSAIWPFHKWLISSLNSPTPVSALMHAGLVNGGGFILARFAPIFFKQPSALNILFIFGLITACLGTLWKLMQSDVKRMLACSTMGQMGFMIVQCGLGLFPAAIAHLCWHGLFKAHLFLSIGSAAKEERLYLESKPSISEFSTSLLCASFGAYAFAVTSGKSIFILNTNLFLILLALISGLQFALTVIQSRLTFKFTIALFSTFIMGCMYGYSVNLLEHVLAPLNIASPQVLNGFHCIGIMILAGAWVLLSFRPKRIEKNYPDWMLKAYVLMLNASQPHPKTVTANRNQYQF